MMALCGDVETPSFMEKFLSGDGIEITGDLVRDKPW
jgi:hypothetical protein